VTRVPAALAVLASLAGLAACGHGDSGTASVKASPSASSKPAFPTVTPSATPSTPPSPPSPPSPVEVAKDRMREVNSFHYVNELRTADGRTLVREEGDVRLDPYGASFTRTVAGEKPLQIIGGLRDYWARSDDGCWQHPPPTTYDYTPPGAVEAILSAGPLRNSSGHVLQLGVSIPAVTSGLGPEVSKAVGVPTDAPYGIVEIRATIDDSGLVTSWETTFGELVAAVERADGHTLRELRDLDASLTTEFTRAGQDVDVAPPPDGKVCSGTTA
jgi:hypothetical protein